MRRIYRVISLIALFAWLSLAAAAAWAIDLTGTWEGTQVCQYFDGKSRVRNFPNDVMSISHTGNDFFFSTPLVDGAVFHAQVIASAKSPANKAQVIFITCGTTEASAYQELGRAATLQVITHGSGARFEATSNFFQTDPDGSRFMGTCLWSYRRVDTADPGVGDCSAASASAAVGTAPAGRPRP
ncbi:MAG TPA: hypothetical protein VGX03_22510 [Candidatus Binatia bacterium]|jgi:hypothetical protein|nr:hypothetical protein [Candidatus Binatia bacterium]